jgi:uncharacterized membrane protein YdjX (TVP38/TMEM64 family)
VETVADMRRYATITLKAILVVAVILGTRYALLRGYVNEAGIHQFVGQAGMLMALGFILFVALGLIIFAPPFLLIGSGALAFGRLMGAVYCLVGMTIGAGAAFLLGRYVATDFAHRRRGGLLKKVNAWIEPNGLAFIFSLRLTLFANPALNYAASLTPVNFRIYALSSFVGLLPGVFAVSYGFDQLTHTPTISWIDFLVHPALASMWLLRLAGIVLLGVLIKWYGRERQPD